MLSTVGPDISHARTPAAAFYTDAQLLRDERERVFARSWQIVGHIGQLAVPGDFFTTIRNDESLLLGPYAPKRENGVHHFHRLMRRQLEL